MPQRHTVQQGECITSIADEYGFFWQTLWDHAENAELKDLRNDPNTLAAGDVVVIPDRELKEDSAASDQKHKYKLKGVPAKMKIRFLWDDEPQADKPCKICIDGSWSESQTDADGYVEVRIPPGAEEGEVRIDRGDDELIYHLQLGHVGPIDLEEGVAARLSNLGYETDDLPSAISAFQSDEDLRVTGTMDDDTRNKLKSRFGQ